MKYYARADDNQNEIVAAARSLGAEVQQIHTVGRGCPDLLVAFRSQWYVVEVKDGSKPASKRALTDAEAEWHYKFGRCAPVHIWEKVEDVFETLLGGYEVRET